VAASSSRRGAGVRGGGTLAADASPVSDPDVCTVIVEDMLVLIAAILSERSRYSVYLLYWALLGFTGTKKRGGAANTDAEDAPRCQFTCFTSTKVQILTQILRGRAQGWA